MLLLSTLVYCVCKDREEGGDGLNLKLVRFRFHLAIHASTVCVLAFIYCRSGVFNLFYTVDTQVALVHYSPYFRAINHVLIVLCNTCMEYEL